MSESRSAARPIGVVLLWLAVAVLLMAPVVAATGGFRFDVFGIPVSMRTAWRMVMVAAILSIAAMVALRRSGSQAPFLALQRALTRHGPLMAWALAIVIGLTTFFGGSHIAAGTDSSGYLSQARLWRSGNLRVATPLANELHDLTLANGQHAFIPAGYQPAGVGVAVPGYPPGLPLLMAVASSIGGERAAFVVVPLSAAGLVLVAFRLGRRLGGTDTALIAAAAVGTAPILIFQSLQPMSDVPAAFWWSLALLLLTYSSNGTAAFGGTAAAVACLVRPNLFALVPLLATVSLWWGSWRRDAWVRALVFATPPVIAAAAFVYLQQVMFGGATQTGYGPFESLFSITHVRANVERYSEWTLFAQSALIVLAIAGPFAIWRRWVEPEIERVAAARVAWSGLLLYAALQVTYLLYLVFDGWLYFRFLLPALPLVLVLQSAVIAAICGRAQAPLRGLAVLMAMVLVASWGAGRARELGAFEIRHSEQRYLDVVEFVGGLPPNAVFVALQHSGPLWYYRSATLLRWDWIDAGEIDRAIAHVSHTGRPVFGVFDDWELLQLRERFSGTNFLQRLTSPIFEAGIPSEIKTQIYAISGTASSAEAGERERAPAAGAHLSVPSRITGTTAGGGLSPFSSRQLPAPRIPRTPAGRDRERDSANSDR